MFSIVQKIIRNDYLGTNEDRLPRKKACRAKFLQRLTKYSLSRIICNQ